RPRRPALRAGEGALGAGERGPEGRPGNTRRPAVLRWRRGEVIREAIQHPSNEGLQEKSWGAVVPLVGMLKKFYEFSMRLEATLRDLLAVLTSTRYTPTQHLEREQALAKQFAEILHFTLRFDELKVGGPRLGLAT
ncbi:hypothetical protein ANANG_G00319190, partial [Anguilla anguilla]